MTVLLDAHRQWASRPDDQRFLTLDDLEAACDRRRLASKESVYSTAKLHVGYDDVLRIGLPTAPEAELGGGIFVNGALGKAYFSHFSFGQMCSRASVPAGYLRQLPAPLAATNLAWGLTHTPAGYKRDAADENAKLLFVPPTALDGQPMDDGEIRAATSPTFGRIWDVDVVRAIKRVNADGRWRVPAASYSAADPLRATTLYASDRDMWAFLVDPEHPLTVGGTTLFRGFIVSNTECYGMKFALKRFLYNRVCDNRMIWGATQIEELSFAHTSGAPDRFLKEVEPAIRAYSEESPRPLEAVIREAKERRFAETPKEAFQTLTKELGFTEMVAKLGLQLAEEGGQSGSDGDPTSVWGVVQGLTAAARGIAHTDERVKVERAAGAIMQRLEKEVAA